MKIVEKMVNDFAKARIFVWIQMNGEILIIPVKKVLLCKICGNQD